MSIKRKKTIYLMGGLGNVLFQINYAHNLKSYGFEVTLNVFLLTENFITKKMLRWPSHDTLSVLNKLGIISSFSVANKLSVNFLFGFLSKLLFNKTVFNSRFYGLSSPNYENLKAAHLFGYFHINNTINLEFVDFAKRMLEKRLCHPDSRCLKETLHKIGSSWVVHIRGGDYKFDPTFAIDMDYYVAATNGKNDFYVVTNDREYSKFVMSNLNINYNFVDSNGALDDFVILALSSKKILANSTFSWWAAEFGECNSIVIQREPFYNHVEWDPLSLCNRQKVVCIK